MSRLGKKAIEIPAGVTIAVSGAEVAVKGPKGELKQVLRPEVKVCVNEAGNELVVEKIGETCTANAMHGLFRALIQNMVIGVTKGYEKKLELFGAGYLAAVAGNVLQIRVGFANEIQKPIPTGITVKCEGQQPTFRIQITGCDKQQVTQFAAEVRAIRKADPYLAKGLKYEGEAIRRKESKQTGKK
ncbi:MAG: 50S ribosomal protein L6 [Thermoguttaceae bacterium]|nr:50S ribosomal protein L6 [Thermoguttaceae bacterium]